MNHRAYVSDDFARFGVQVHLIEDRGDGRRAIAEPIDITFTESADVGTYVEPTLRLSESAARALLDALAVHFGGSSDVQTLRKDYLAERARVDKMIDHLVVRVTP